MASNPLEIYLFGHHSPKDIIIWCPHDADDIEFFSKYPHILEILDEQHSAHLIQRYLSIERDFGSLALAKEIAEILTEMEPSLTIAVISATIPRGIIDPARITSCSKRNIFLNNNDLIDDELIDLHIEALHQLQSYILDLKPHGLFIDLHTMAPCDPKVERSTPTEYIIEAPHTLEKYVDLYRYGQNGGRRRSVDLITSDQKQNQLADKILVSSLQKNLDINKVKFAHNDPFSSGDHLIASSIMRKNRGVTIDVPKDLLANESIDDPWFDLLKITLCKSKVNKLAAIFAQSFLSSLQVYGLN